LNVLLPTRGLLKHPLNVEATGVIKITFSKLFRHPLRLLAKAGKRVRGKGERLKKPFPNKDASFSPKSVKLFLHSYSMNRVHKEQ